MPTASKTRLGLTGAPASPHGATTGKSPVSFVFEVEAAAMTVDGARAADITVDGAREAGITVDGARQADVKPSG